MIAALAIWSLEACGGGDFPRPMPEEYPLQEQPLEKQVLDEVHARVFLNYYRKLELEYLAKCLTNLSDERFTECLDPHSFYVPPRPEIKPDSKAQFYLKGIRALVLSFNLAGRIWYIPIYNFEKNTADSFSKTLSYLRSSGACGAVLDLRNNPGGLVEEARKMAAIFSKRAGEVLFVERGRWGLGRPAVSGSVGEFKDFPAVILAGSKTASSAEIFTGVLQGWEYSVVGVRTYGKGLVQKDFGLQNGGRVHLTVAESFLGSDLKKIDGVGINPDFVVERAWPEREILDYWADDPQLQKAIEILKNRTVSCRD